MCLAHNQMCFFESVTILCGNSSTLVYDILRYVISFTLIHDNLECGNFPSLVYPQMIATLQYCLVDILFIEILLMSSTSSCPANLQVNRHTPMVLSGTGQCSQVITCSMLVKYISSQTTGIYDQIS